MKIMPMLLALLAAALSNQAHAEMSIAAYMKLDHHDPQVRAFVAGIATGIQWMNTYSDMNGGGKAYCQPEKLALNFDTNSEILDAFIKDGHPDPKLPLGFAMLKAYQYTFPCK